MAFWPETAVRVPFEFASRVILTAVGWLGVALFSLLQWREPTGAVIALVAILISGVVYGAEFGVYALYQLFAKYIQQNGGSAGVVE